MIDQVLETVSRVLFVTSISTVFFQLTVKSKPETTIHNKSKGLFFQTRQQDQVSVLPSR